jgi:hypothetical protein
MPSEQFKRAYENAPDDSDQLVVKPYTVGTFVGGVLGIALLCLLLRLVFRRFLDGNVLIVVTVFSAVALATFLFAFGSADGGPPNFGGSFAQYGIGGVIVLVLWLVKARGKAVNNG